MIYYVEGRFNPRSLEEIKEIVKQIDHKLRETEVNETISREFDYNWSFMFQTDTSPNKEKVEDAKKEIEKIFEENEIKESTLVVLETTLEKYRRM